MGHLVYDMQYLINFDLVNGTPHPITFQTPEGEDFTILPSGWTFPAQAVEEIVPSPRSHLGITFVRTVFQATPNGLEEIHAAQMTFPHAILVGSIISAQAYPGSVFAMVPVPGLERVQPAQKRMQSKKFTTF